MGYAVNVFKNVKKLQRKEYLKNTHMKYTTFVKKAMNRRDQKQQLKTSENNYNNKKKKEQKQRQNLQKIHECTKK